MARIPFITAGGIGISLVVLVMVLASITLLPALLGLAGHRVNGRRRAREAATGRTWRRWGEHVSRHATGYAVGATALLLALAAPVTALRLGFPDEGTMPQSRTERRAYDLIESRLRAGRQRPAGHRGRRSRATRPSSPPLSAAVAADPGIAEVSTMPVDSPLPDVAVLVAEPTTEPAVRGHPRTPSTGCGRRCCRRSGRTARPAPTSAVQVAVFADLGDRVQDRLPYFIAAVVLLSFVLLMVMFRSLLVPLKAAVMNLLSVSAAYGVLVMVFQWGWGADLIGLESTVPILSFIPLFMFAILFGLSMDYEVFLLSRVREEYLRTGDNDEAVVRGLAGTARTITSAAMIMVAVFGGFALGQDPLAR